MLSSETIKSLFARMAVRYGNSWRTRWDGLEIEAVATDWLHVLRGLSTEQVIHGLAHLPEFVPTAHQFREACLRAPTMILPVLPEPPADPVVVAKAVTALQKLGQSRIDPKVWAYRLKAREASGEKLTKAQRDMWRAAIQVEDHSATNDAADVARTARLKAISAAKVAAYQREHE